MKKVSRREFLKTFGLALAALSDPDLTIPAATLKLLSDPPAPAATGALGLKAFTGVSQAYTQEDVAFWVGELAYTSSAPIESLHDIGQIGFMRNALKGCPAVKVEQLLAHKNEVLGWFQQEVARDNGAIAQLAQAGMDNVQKLYAMSDAQFADYSKELRQQLRTRSKESPPRKHDENPQTGLRWALRDKKLVIQWDTIKHATTPRIKITVAGTVHPERAIAAMEEKLRLALPRDDIDINTIENRIIIRNPSAEAKEMLRPYLLQKNQQRGV